MAISVTENLIKGHHYHTTPTSRELVRVFDVDGLTPGPAVMLDAVAAVDASDSTKRVPPYGETIQNLIADDFDATPFPENSRTGARVVVTYHDVNFSSVVSPVFRLGGTSRSILTNYDYAGERIKVAYKPPGGIIAGRIGQVERFKAYGILTVERVENESPIGRLIYVDAINSDEFYGQPKYTWAMRDIQIEKVLYASGFKVCYTMEFDWQTHIKTAIWRDDITDTIPADVDTNPDPLKPFGNGWRNVRVNKALPFKALGLPNPFVP